MIGRKQVDEPPGDRAGVRGFAAAAQLPYDRLARRGRARDADEVEGEIIDQPEIGAPDPDRQMLGQVPVRAQGPHAQFGDRLVIAGSAEFAQRNEHVRAGIVRRYAGALLFYGAPSRQPPDREAGFGCKRRLVKRRRVERSHRDLFPPAGIVGIDFEHPVRLVIQVVAAVRDDVILVLTGFELDAVGGFLEQVDGGGRIERKSLRPGPPPPAAYSIRRTQRRCRRSSP